tara:strand:- start:300 stop:578 length:279 start_codon:yes stop_codon:yes gene_type:complete
MNFNLIKGCILGVFYPIILFIVVVVFFRDYSLIDFINIQLTKSNLPSIISLSLLSNLAFFFIKLKMNKDEQSRGILISTFLYGFVIIILKFM